MNAAVHISLNVSNLDKSIDFYRRFFGEPQKLKPGYAKFVLKNPEIHLALQAGLPGKVGVGTLSHLGLRVDSTENVLHWRDTLKERGLSTLDEMQRNCCFALQDKFWITDPDGNRWEVYTVLEDH